MSDIALDPRTVRRPLLPRARPYLLSLPAPLVGVGIAPEHRHISAGATGRALAHGTHRA